MECPLAVYRLTPPAYKQFSRQAAGALEYKHPKFKSVYTRKWPVRLYSSRWVPGGRQKHV